MSVISHYAGLLNVIIAITGLNDLHFIDETAQLSEWNLFKPGSVRAENQILFCLIPLIPLGLPSTVPILTISAFSKCGISFMITV